MTDLKTLTDQWIEAKKQEQYYTNQRFNIELSIYELTHDQLKETGTTTLETGMKVTTGYSEAWDNAQVRDLIAQWPYDVKFPFEQTWKPDGKAISYLRDNVPALYRMLQPALTIRPRKPSFSIKE